MGPGGRPMWEPPPRSSPPRACDEPYRVEAALATVSAPGGRTTVACVPFPVRAER